MKVEIPVQLTQEVRNLSETLKIVLPAFGVEFNIMERVINHTDNTEQSMIWLRWLSEPKELPVEKICETV